MTGHNASLQTQCSLNCPLPRCWVLPSWPSCFGVRRGGVAPPSSLRMLLPFRCAFANSHLIAIDSQTHRKTTKGRTVDHDVPSRLAR